MRCLANPAMVRYSAQDRSWSNLTYIFIGLAQLHSACLQSFSPYQTLPLSLWTFASLNLHQLDTIRVIAFINILVPGMRRAPFFVMFYDKFTVCVKLLDQFILSSLDSRQLCYPALCPGPWSP